MVERPERMDEDSTEKEHLQENGGGDSLTEKPYSFNVVPYSIERHFEFLDICKDGCLLLGSSSMTIQNWIGSIWLFENSDVLPTKEDSVCGRGFESCVSCGLFMESREKVIIGEDTGMLSILSIERFEENSTHFMPHKSQSHHEGSIEAISLSQNKKQTISCGRDLRLNIWDNSNLELQTMYECAHSRTITCVNTVLEEGSPLFCSAGLDGLILLWDPRLSKPASAVYSSSCGFTSIAWKNENEIYIGSLSGEIVLSDIRYKNELQKLKFSKYPVHKLSIYDNFIAACGETNNILVWDCDSHILRYSNSKHSGLVRGLAWNPINKKLYSCGFDSRIYSHNIPMDF